jgi:hypothetical protein
MIHYPSEWGEIEITAMTVYSPSSSQWDESRDQSFAADISQVR